MITREDKEAEQLGTESEESSTFYKETAADKELLKFIVGHTDSWRDYRDQNYADKWDRYERIFRGIWEEADKERGSERSRLISPATQQAIETRHAEIMEAIFGQGEFFDTEDATLRGLQAEQNPQKYRPDHAHGRDLRHRNR